MVYEQQPCGSMSHCSRLCSSCICVFGCMHMHARARIDFTTQGACCCKDLRPGAPAAARTYDLGHLLLQSVSVQPLVLLACQPRFAREFRNADLPAHRLVHVCRPYLAPPLTPPPAPPLAPPLALPGPTWLYHPARDLPQKTQP